MKKKRILSATAAVLLAVATPMSSMAATWDISKGNIIINAKADGQTVTQGDQVDVPDNNPIIICVHAYSLIIIMDIGDYITWTNFLCTSKCRYIVYPYTYYSCCFST